VMEMTAGTVSAPTSTAAAPASATKADWRFKLFNRVVVGVLLALALLWLVPLAWAVDTALKPEALTTQIPISWFPGEYTLDAFRQVIQAGDLLHWYANSAITSTLITLTTVVAASMAAFALSQVSFRGRRLMFWFILAGIMIPVQAMIVPLFRELNSAGLVNTYWAVILPQIPLPIAVFVFKQFFDGIPHELADAAVVDGASRLHVYWRIWMPLSRPVIAAVAIFSFVLSWNYFLWPFIVITGTRTMTIPVGLATVQTAYGIHYAQIMASAVLGALPLLVVFLLFQRRIVEGIAGTGLKG
jgi:multiple sugar transport system permease protein